MFFDQCPIIKKITIYYRNGEIEELQFDKRDNPMIYETKDFIRLIKEHKVDHQFLRASEIFLMIGHCSMIIHPFSPWICVGSLESVILEYIISACLSPYDAITLPAPSTPFSRNKLSARIFSGFPNKLARKWMYDHWTMSDHQEDHDLL